MAPTPSERILRVSKLKWWSGGAGMRGGRRGKPGARNSKLVASQGATPAHAQNRAGAAQTPARLTNRRREASYHRSAARADRLWRARSARETTAWVIGCGPAAAHHEYVHRTLLLTSYAVGCVGVRTARQLAGLTPSMGASRNGLPAVSDFLVRTAAGRPWTARM